MCVCVCVCVRVCVLRQRERESERERERERELYRDRDERERERERERELNPFPDLPTPKYICQYSKLPVSVFSDLWPHYLVFVLFWFFCRCTTYQSQQKCQRTMFSIIYLLRTVWELTFSIKQMHYKTGTLWHSDASILFTSAKVPSASASTKVFLDKRP